MKTKRILFFGIIWVLFTSCSNEGGNADPAHIDDDSDSSSSADSETTSEDESDGVSEGGRPLERLQHEHPRLFVRL